MRILFFAACFALIGTFTASSARAEPQTGEEAGAARAAARFQQGVELYREGSYEGALAEFRKAYELSPSYRVLYNIAQAQYALRDFVGAYRTLMQYLTEGSNEVGGERRAQVQELAGKLSERIASLQISTNVAGADIRVDDVSVGTAPLAGPIPVNVGTRKVTAFKAGSPEAVRIVTVAGKEKLKIDLQIESPGSSVTQPALRPASQGSPVVPEAREPTAPSRVGLVVSLSTTAALAVGTGVFGYLALGAQSDFKDQVNTYPNTREKVDDARSKSRTYGYVADAMGAAALISGGVALYFAVTHARDSRKREFRKSAEPIVLAPTLGGMVLSGSF